MAPGSLAQDQFGGGIFRGRRAPGDSVYDAINALLNDERELYRRGGSAYKSGSNADGALLGLWDGITIAGQRTLFWSATSPYVLSSNDSTVLDLGTEVPAALSSAVEIAGVVVLRGGLVSGQETEVIYAGSRKTATYSTGTISITAGSQTVTGAGTAWLANVDPGMVLQMQPNNLSFIGIVKSVESDTSLTLVDPSVLTSGSLAYNLLPIVRYELENSSGAALLPPNPTTAGHAVAGQRLIRFRDNRVYFSARRDFFSGANSFLKSAGIAYPIPVQDVTVDFHELPRASLIVGADSIEDTVICFTTSGVWAVSNMAMDTFDDVGNIQRQVAQINQDLILWGEPGITSYEGALIVPAIDDVVAFSLGAPPIPVSQGVRPLYREYVEAGYKPGLATVYRGHYFLPVLDGSNNVVDVLVCRLDLASGGSRRPGWTRQANGAAGRAYATRVGAATRSPQLLGLDGLRVSNLTGIFDPDSTRKADADATNHALTIISNDVPTGPGGRPNTVLSALVTTELVDAASDNPTYAFATATGAEGASFTTATAQDTGASTAPESDGTTPTTFSIVRKVDRIRWRFQTAGAAAFAILRRVELRIRQSGRQ